jgi:hypothetical protein
LTLEDFLLFSEYSLNYLKEFTIATPFDGQARQWITEKDEKQEFEKLRKDIAPRQFGSSDEAKAVVVCSICNLTAYGLVYYCSECGHGGHYDHLMGWLERHRAAYADKSHQQQQ